MNDKATNTKYIFTFEDGDTCEMTLAFYLLYQLKTKNRKLYDKYNELRMNGTEDIIEWIEMLYVAYICANIDNIESCMSEEDFIKKCGSGLSKITKAVTELTEPKKA